MTQQEKANIANPSTKKTNAPKSSASSPIRIRIQSKAKLDALLERVNRDRVGRKVKADDLICRSLDLLTDTHLEEIGSKVMTNKERVEVLFRKLAKTRRGLTREEFLGMLLDGKVPV